MGSELDRDLHEVTPDGEVFIFVRFRVCPGREGEFEAALSEVLGPTKDEPGNLAISAFRSIREAGVYYVRSRWRDEAAFDAHIDMPHTKHFIERAEALTGREVLAARTTRIG